MTFLNTYASTETNGVSFHEIAIGASLRNDTPLPIGTGCFDAEIRLADDGELWVSGPAISIGYWNQSALNERAFVTDATGCRWFRTGDLAVWTDDGGLRVLGRKDRMVKKRGYRVEPDEIEALLLRHSAIAEVAVIASADDESGTLLTAFFCTLNGAPLRPAKLRAFCARVFPSYLIPDRFSQLESLPKTASGKVDLQKLRAKAGEARS